MALTSSYSRTRNLHFWMLLRSIVLSLLLSLIFASSLVLVAYAILSTNYLTSTRMTGRGAPQNDREEVRLRMTMKGGDPQIVIPNGVRNLRSPFDGLPITTTVWRHLRDSLNKSPWMRRMDVKPVPAEGGGSRIRGNDGLGAAGMTGFRRVVQRFPRTGEMRDIAGWLHEGYLRAQV